MPPRQPDSITGIFEAERWRPRDASDGNDFVIACLRDGTTIVGNAPQGDLIWNLPYTFYGQWEQDRRSPDGKQFKFTTYRQEMPHSREGVVSYLRRHCNGIGGAIGGRLWDALGTDAVKVLRLNPERAVAAVDSLSSRSSRLTIDVARAASVALTAIQKFEDVKIELANLFSGRGFPGSLTDKVIKEWGALAPRRIKHDPFAMLSRGYPGCGFVRCDRLYSDLGLPPGRTRRQLMSIVHSIREGRGGHTWFPAAMLKKQLEKNIGAGVKLDFARAVKMGVRARWLAVRPDGYVAEYQSADNEWRVAQKVRELLAWGDCR